jgi:hypothetical protein
MTKNHWPCREMEPKLQWTIYQKETQLKQLDRLTIPCPKKSEKPRETKQNSITHRNRIHLGNISLKVGPCIQSNRMLVRFRHDTRSFLIARSVRRWGHRRRLRSPEIFTRTQRPLPQMPINKQRFIKVSVFDYLGILNAIKMSSK